jgi:hypothetical protein
LAGERSARAANIDYDTVIIFSEYAVGTPIVRQYAKKGIVFGGDKPFITGDAANPTSPVLSGTPLFTGAIEGTFVNKITGLPTVVNGFAFDAGFFNNKGSVRVTLFDTNGKVLHRRTNGQLGIQHFDFSGIANVRKWRIEAIGDEPAGFGIDNVAMGPRQNLVKNGSFETPLVPSGGYTTYSIGKTFGYWRVIGDANPVSNNVDLVRGNFSAGGVAFPAQKGNQWLDLTGGSNKPTGVVQTIPTVAGQCYELSFYVGTVNNPGAGFGTRSWVNVSFAGVPAASAKWTNTAATTKMLWHQFKRIVKATTSSSQLIFINADPTNDTANGLDDVRLAPSSC